MDDCAYWCYYFYFFIDYLSNREIWNLTDKNGTVEVVLANFNNNNRSIKITKKDELKMIKQMFANSEHINGGSDETQDISYQDSFFGYIEISNYTSIKLDFYLDKNKHSNKVFIKYQQNDDWFRGYVLRAPPEIVGKLEEAFRKPP